MTKPLLPAKTEDSYLPVGCTCSAEGEACDRCKVQRERIAKMYRRTG